MSALAMETFWLNKSACDDAERAYYEKLSGCKVIFDFVLSIYDGKLLRAFFLLGGYPTVFLLSSLFRILHIYFDINFLRRPF